MNERTQSKEELKRRRLYKRPPGHGRSTQNMATTSLIQFSTFTAFLCISIMLSSTIEVMTGKAELCERARKTFSGFCGYSSSCDKKCKGEGAAKGACHNRGIGLACLCYFNC